VKQHWKLALAITPHCLEDIQEVSMDNLTFYTNKELDMRGIWEELTYDYFD
jgi:hypothetical protein